MNEKFAQYRARLTQFWNANGQKTKNLVGAHPFAVLLLSIILLTIVFSRTDYEFAFHDLDSNRCRGSYGLIWMRAKSLINLADDGKTFWFRAADAARS